MKRSEAASGYLTLFAGSIARKGSQRKPMLRCSNFIKHDTINVHCLESYKNEHLQIQYVKARASNAIRSACAMPRTPGIRWDSMGT